MKELISLPSGSKPKQAIIKDMPDLPGGSKGKPFYIREDISLPQQSDNEILSAGINGLVDPLSPVSRPLGYLSSVKNLIRSGKTGAETRPGIGLVGNQVGASKILGIVPFYPSAGNRQLIAAAGTTWKKYNYSTFVFDTLSTGMAANNLEGASFDDSLILVNGVNVKKYDGTTLSDLGGNPPFSPYIAVGYRRVFLVNLPHQVVVSDAGNPENYDTGDSAALSISAKDGDIITWIQFYRMNLYIWKRHSLHELHGPELGYISANWRDFRVHNCGTLNGRTVAEIGGVLYWLSDSNNYKGIVSWAGGAQPLLLSDRPDRPSIQGIIDRINWGAAASVAAAGTDGAGNYLLSVPLDNASTPTHTIVYSTIDGSWWVWEGWLPSVYGSARLATSAESPVFGDNSGYVYSIGGSDDNGTPIEYEAIVGPAILGLPMQEKRVRRAYVIAAGGQAEQFTLFLGGATGGTYTLGNGKTNTAALAHNASAATIQTALEVIYGAGKVSVAVGTNFNIVFDVTVGASNLEADFALLTGTTGTPALTQTPQEMQAATSAADVGAFDDPVTIEFTNTQIQRIKKYLPLNTGDPMGGYVYRLKVSGEGAVKLYEVGFEIGARRV